MSALSIFVDDFSISTAQDTEEKAAEVITSTYRLAVQGIKESELVVAPDKTELIASSDNPSFELPSQLATLITDAASSESMSITARARSPKYRIPNIANDSSPDGPKLFVSCDMPVSRLGTTSAAVCSVVWLTER